MPENNTFFKTPLAEYSNDNVTVFMVDGSTIRDPLTKPYDLDFTEGDNDMHNPDMVPPGEVWVDLDVAPTEVRCTILHELTERRAMIEKGVDYETAHNDYANVAEEYARAHRDELNDLVMAELKLAPKYKPPLKAKSMSDLKIQYKYVRCETKSADPLTGVIDMLIPVSTDSTDRIHESISAEAWTKRLPVFMKRPILVSSHDYSDIRKQIGEFISLVPTPQGLMGKPKYYINQGNDEADWAFNIASKGMAAYSVGFIPYDFIQSEEKDAAAIQYTDCELLEISQVVVPCNRDAIQAQRSKSVDPVVSKLLDDLTVEVDKMETKKAKEYSQDEIADQIDFLTQMVEKSTLSPENQALLRRLAGGDTPDIDIKSVKARITHAMTACKTAMDTMAEHDKAHEKAFKCHSESIIKCYNGLKSMLANQDKPDDTTGDTTGEAAETEDKAVDIDSIVSKVTSKY